ncbi:MAG: hypothetical protein LKI92_08970 [Schleiferilactobacillus harbinensis]|jgi:hypothetical protein|nr:hypothetical protein [Schleiferilactobacillus harbinensis]MCI1914084.1 hypothetical protein [Schleiferilactobacillus harbinensis]
MKANIIVKLQEMAVAETADSTDSWASGFSVDCSAKDAATTLEANSVVKAA